MARHPNPGHGFGQRRPSQAPPHPQQSPLFKGSPFQPLPAPTGASPFRLDLEAIVPKAVAAARKAGGMAFHVVGDTGGVLDPNPQTLVAAGMEHDAGVSGQYGVPAFFYHLGDVVYFDGQAEQYVPQFYDPYAHYPLPIIGIPGNHDGDVFDDGTRTNPLPSLATFVRNFCAATPGTHSPDAGEASRTAMIQPNVYWTLNTPFATIIGLYTNVPEGGVVEADQAAWFVGELQAAPTDRALIVALHHPIYSLDTYHSGSKPMATLLANSFASAGRSADMVFTAHVHNYQRFSIADVDGGGVTPYFVAGQGGYHNLHKVAKINGQPLITPYAVPGQSGVTLNSYYDDRFGFLRLEVSPNEIAVSAYTVPRPQEPWDQVPTLFDTMRFDWKQRRLVTGS
ncbi:metallophosphoesterase family protein [Lichenicoccus sp.]|uniref:metallophosphoesterase family protein n=1 Tax=Lichenicoccus sp. TaxID=2781899 RepID=UPI003D100C41